MLLGGEYMGGQGWNWDLSPAIVIGRLGVSIGVGAVIIDLEVVRAKGVSSGKSGPGSPLSPSVIMAGGQG